MAGKPPVVRLLEQRRLTFTVHEFDHSIRSAEDVARHTGIAPARVYKTLVVETTPPGTPALVMAPAGTVVDLKKVANALGVKRVRMAAHRQAERLTGLQVGAISALALVARRWPTLLDLSAQRYPEVLVSAGVRGMDVEVAVADLLRLTGARLADVVQD